MSEKIAELKNLLSELMANLPRNTGSIHGLAASWYPKEDRPVRRVASDGVVLELACDLLEEEQIITETSPVDWSRREDGESVVFMWLTHCDERVRQIYRDHRMNSQERFLKP